MKELDQQELRSKAYAKALKLLSRREHSESELRRKLSSDELHSQTLDGIVSQLLEQRYLCNRRFVSMLCRSRYEKGYGIRYIQQELAQHRLSSELLTDVLAESEFDWFERARALRIKRCPELPDDLKEQFKQKSYLLRRGFSDEEVRYAMQSSVD